MPTIQFKGKNIIWNHHLAIPYHALDEDKKLGYNTKFANGNIIIEGDNLIALKALLPKYGGKIKCIYIDPPYNTGNEKWVYNDNVNSPMLRDWFGKIVDKDDLTRHDKWLCMMVPRLKLLRELLSDNGVIFISIDMNEESNLVGICDEIFGDNKISKLVWKGKSGAEDDNYFRTVHEFVLVYAKDKSTFKAGLQTKDNESFPHYDSKKEKYYKTQLLRKWGSNSRREDRENLYYPIKGPDGKSFYPKLPNGNDGCWRWSPDEMKKAFKEKIIEFKRNKSGVIEAYEKIFEPEEDEIRYKKFQTILDDVNSTSKGTKELQELFGGTSPFPYPKPTALIKRLLLLANIKKNEIILDSFAGSGTTMQAVFDMNEDGGDRTVISIQMAEATKAEPKKNICKEITRERVKRVIDEYGYKSGFRYLRVGLPIDAESMLSGNLPSYKQFARYVYYLCTGEDVPDEKKINEKDFFVGETKTSIIYLMYSKNYDALTKLALSLNYAEQFLKKHSKKRIIVYAPACFLDDEYLYEKQIQFVNIPYNLFEKN